MACATYSARRAALGQLLERAVLRGELTRREVPITTDLIYGSLWYRVVFGVGRLDNRWADAVARAVRRAVPPLG